MSYHKIPSAVSLSQYRLRIRPRGGCFLNSLVARSACSLVQSSPSTTILFHSRVQSNPNITTVHPLQSEESQHEVLESVAIMGQNDLCEYCTSTCERSRRLTIYPPGTCLFDRESTQSPASKLHIVLTIFRLWSSFCRW